LFDCVEFEFADGNDEVADEVETPVDAVDWAPSSLREKGDSKSLSVIDPEPPTLVIDIACLL
jgi:hypothetical protein